jgi:hypothetical protein
MGRQRRRRKQLVDDLREMRGYWKSEEEAIVALCGKLALEEAVGLSLRKSAEYINVL